MQVPLRLPLGSVPSEMELDILKQSANTKGGYPAETYLLRTPPFDALSQPYAGREVFKREVPVAGISSLFGKDGSLAIRTVPLARLLGLAILQFEIADIVSDFSPALLFKRAREAPGSLYLNPSDAMISFLAQQLSELQYALLLETREDIINPTKRVLDSPEMIGGMSCKSDGYEYARPEIGLYLRHLCEFRQVGDLDPVRSFLLRVGGLIQLRIIH